MLFTEAERAQLLANGIASREKDHIDHVPVVKLFTPDANATWLLTELYPDDPSIAFGLCDLGLGFPELGDVSVTEIEALRGRLGLPVEKDEHFTAAQPISEYAKAARDNQRIMT